MASERWLRHRFYCPTEGDVHIPEEANWPPPGPYWISGYGYGPDEEELVVVIAWFPSDADILRYWPDARDIESELCGPPTFTDRFLSPDWWDESTNAPRKEPPPGETDDR